MIFPCNEAPEQAIIILLRSLGDILQHLLQLHQLEFVRGEKKKEWETEIVNVNVFIIESEGGYKYL